MKKVLIGLAAGALAVAATGAGSASAAGTSVYDVLKGRTAAKVLIDASGLASALDDCGNTGNNNGLPDYTVFFPAADAIFEAVLAELDLTLGEIAAQPALVKTVLLYHVHKGNISPVQLADNSTTKIETMGGLTLIKTSKIDTFYTYDTGGYVSPRDTNGVAAFNTFLPLTVSYDINGYDIVGFGTTYTYSTDYNTGLSGSPATIDVADDVHTQTSKVTAGGVEACNGWVYLINGFLAPSSAIATQGLTTDGTTTQAQANTAPTGDGLPATGSESMALTYAALASLIAGAGVLVIRRRSVA